MNYQLIQNSSYFKTRRGLMTNHQMDANASPNTGITMPMSSTKEASVQTPLHMREEATPSTKTTTTKTTKSTSSSSFASTSSSLFMKKRQLLLLIASLLPSTSTAIAIRSNNFSTLASAGASTSSNALSLLNTARLMREQKLSSTTVPGQIKKETQTQARTKAQAQDQATHQYHALPLPELLRRTQQSTKKANLLFPDVSSTWTEALFDDAAETLSLSSALLNREEEFISHRVKKQLPDVKRLLSTSQGNDVPDMALHLQMEAARARGRESGSVAALAFMDLHHGVGGASSYATTKNGKRDSRTSSSNSRNQDLRVRKVTAFAASASSSTSSSISQIEKFAMTSLPSQLPGLAAPVLNGSNSNNVRKTTSVVKAATSATKTRTRAPARTRATTAVTTKETRVSSSVPTSATATTTTIATKKKRVTTKSMKKRIIANANANANVTLRRSNKRTSKEAIMKTSKHIQMMNSNEQQQQQQPIKKIRTKPVSNIMAARKALSTSSSEGTARVSHDEEIQLARIIQRGAELHSIKTKFELENMRDITRQEWTTLATDKNILDNPKDLRRLVSAYRKAKNKLVMANMGLVHAVVRSRMRESGQGNVSYSGISYEELVQEGSLGLLRAAELFDPCRGLRFSTYATIWIKGVLGNNSLSEQIKLPLRERNKWKKIQDSIKEINAVKGNLDDSGRNYKPSNEEIGSHCGLSPKDVKEVMTKMKRTKNVLSLDYQYDSTTRSGVDAGKFDALSNDKNMMDDVDLVERLQLRADIVAALARNLDPREARLMRLRYGLNDGKTRSISDCAGSMGISKARAQQLAVGCLKKLRQADDAESLQEYLLSVA